MAKVPHISHFDMSTICFGPVTFVGPKKEKVKINVFRDASSTSDSNRFNRVNLCCDAKQPMFTKYALDSVREDGNPDRRGLTIRVTDTVTRETLNALDEMVIKKAVESSKEWFGKAGKPLPQGLSEDVVRDRYQKLVGIKDDEPIIKVKVKTGGLYPTTMHLNEDGRFRKHAGKPTHITRDAAVVPIVSLSYGIWIIPGGKFGLTMQVEEMMITPNESAADDLSHFASSTPIMMHHQPSPPPPSSEAIMVEALPICAEDEE